MADSAKSPTTSSLNPTAPAFTMPAQTSRVLNGPSEDPLTQPVANGQPKQKKQAKRSEDQVVGGKKPATSENAAADAGAGVKLAGAELKKQKAAEKAARRAEKVAEKVAEKGALTLQAQAETRPSSQPQVQAQAQAQAQRPDAQRRLSGSKKEGESFHKRSGSSSGKQVPARSAGLVAEPKEKLKDEKKVAMFSHLPGKEKRVTLAGAGKEVHPAVLALGLQIRNYVICGANARCVATLLVFKKVIQAYTTPPGIAMSRHLTTHLSHQISYLSHARPLSISQGNSIRWLKKLVSTLDPDLSDSSAKQLLCTSIDQFIREKVTLADELIAREASQRIVDGDVLLTYSKSSIVEKTLLSAHEQGKKFKVIVVDSRPLFEGKNTARSLAAAGVEVQYSLLNGLPDVVNDVTKCFLGASAMMGNGRLYSRAGSAMVAMMAKDTGQNVPVIVLCESIKFTGRVALDSIVMNELGDADSLVESEQSEIISTISQSAPQLSKGGKKGGKVEEEPPSEEGDKRGLEGWRDQPNLHLLNLMYDVTPAEYLDIVISELGSLPPYAVPVVNGVQGSDE